jgi:hypothetical protein
MIPMKKCSILSRAKGRRLCRQNCRDVAAKLARRVLPGAAMRCALAMIFCVIAGLLNAFAHVERPVINLQGGCITPSAPNEHIRLDVMRVIFRAKRDSYSVDASYHLFNTGKTTTVTVGVPKYGRSDRDQEYHSGEPIVRDFLGFDAWVNGRKAEFVEARDFFTDPSAQPVGGYCHGDKKSETRWMTKRVTFTGKATTVIRVRYEAHYHIQSGISGFVYDAGYYHVSVGRYWKDRIKRATFVSDITDINDDRIRSYEGWVAFTGFLGVSEIRQWEPSSRSYKEIIGSWEGANWKGPWKRGPKAPTPCDRSQW